MSVLVTGGAGYIGSIIVEQLSSRGEEVVVLDDLRGGHRQAVTPSANFVQGTYANAELLKRVFREHHVCSIIHMAAEAVIARSMNDPRAFFDNNVIDAIVLLDTMVEYDVRKIVFSSSAATFGEPQFVPVTEDHPQFPINPYGETKLIFEKALKWYAKAYDIHAISLRYFNAAGASSSLGEDHEPESHLIPLVLRVALGQLPRVQVFGDQFPTADGSCVRDYVHVADLAELHILALAALDRIKLGAFNAGTGTGYSVLEVVKAARDVTGHEIPAIISPPRPGDPAVLVASNEEAGRELGWKPRYELKTIISDAWNWHREHPHGYGKQER